MTKSQAQLGRKERFQNLQDAFSLISNANISDNSLLILVDDVTTTGSTFNELAKIVKRKYNKISIRGIVVGRHMG